MHGIMVGKKEIVFQTTCSEDDRLFLRIYLLFEQQEGDRLAFFGRFFFQSFVCSFKVVKMRDAFVVSWLGMLTRIQAHLWNSVAGINVGMGYFFLLRRCGVSFVEAKNGWPEVKVEVRKSFSPAFRLVSWQETSIFEKEWGPFIHQI